MLNKIFSRFKRKKLSKLTEFQTSEILENTEYFDNKLLLTMARISENDRKRIEKTSDEFEKHLESLFEFWTKNDFTLKALKESNLLFLKSYTESMVVIWMLLINYFAKEEIRDESIEKVLFYSICLKFESYGKHLFNEGSFYSFKSLLENRSKIYPEILKNFFKPRDFESESYNKLFYLIIENPTIKEPEFELDFLKWGEIDRMTHTNNFISIYSKSINEYSNKISEIWKN